MEFALAYTRVSTDFERQPNSVRIHDGAIRDYCALRSITVVDLEQENVSGKIPMEKRRGGARILRGLREGVEWQGRTVFPRHLLFGAVDRIGRRAGPMMMLVESLIQQGIRVHIAEPGIGNIDLNEPAGWSQFQTLCVQAEAEHRRLIKRIRDGFDRRRRDGLCCTDRAPYGWDAVPSGKLNPKPRAKHPEYFRQEPNPEQQHWLRQMIEWRFPLAPFDQITNSDLRMTNEAAARGSAVPQFVNRNSKIENGLSLTAIAARLNALGAPTKTEGGRAWKNNRKELITTSGLWHAGNVKRILENPATLALANEMFGEPLAEAA
jgi:DNA invertase Pin-like site-specific DNA recombinase